jgi:hypothetical protein
MIVTTPALAGGRPVKEYRGIVAFAATMAASRASVKLG